MVRFRPIDDLDRLCNYATLEQFGRILRALDELEGQIK